jgi:hypothetical protein
MFIDEVLNRQYLPGPLVEDGQATDHLVALTNDWLQALLRLRSCVGDNDVIAKTIQAARAPEKCLDCPDTPGLRRAFKLSPTDRELTEIIYQRGVVLGLNLADELHGSIKRDQDNRRITYWPAGKIHLRVWCEDGSCARLVLKYGASHRPTSPVTPMVKLDELHQYNGLDELLADLSDSRLLLYTALRQFADTDRLYQEQTRQLQDARLGCAAQTALLEAQL